jgi:HAD superfamily hydrolase (TIGR01509 family)
VVEAVLFDLDGILVDSVSWHEEALDKALVEVCGFKFEDCEGSHLFAGRPTRDKLTLLCDLGKVSQDKFSEVIELKKKYLDPVVRERAKVDLEKQELQEQLMCRGYQVACITNSNRKAALSVLKAIDQLKYFKLVVAGDDMIHRKPCGEGYVTAMVLLGSVPQKTIIVEDSLLGIQAAESTGAHVWVVDHHLEVTWDNFQKFLGTIT